jgi:RNA 3'-terminal phosphate cyclase
MLELDGSLGKGGGQILRTSLALSLVTGKAFHLFNLRASNRRKQKTQSGLCFSVSSVSSC